MISPPARLPIWRANLVLAGVTLVFTGLAVLLFANLWGQPAQRPDIPRVDPALINPAPSYASYDDLVQSGGDVAMYSCYICHEQSAPPKLKFDEHQRVIVPEVHANIVMGHGTHNRNNHCYNCHNEANLETFHIRDGRDLPLSNSPALCGSCHGPTYRDWEAGAHGRISGYWDRTKGPAQRLLCVNCHNPHSPAIPARKPAPGPHSLHPILPPAKH
jgi:uncharacterized CHY-type Zn-finger protein